MKYRDASPPWTAHAIAVVYWASLFALALICIQMGWR
jgi:hypothetical protein